MKDRIGSAAELYEALTRKGFVLPAFSSELCCLSFMQDVLHMKVYCPTIKEYKKHNCVDPPKKEIVRDELIGLIEKNMQRLDLTQQCRF